MTKKYENSFVHKIGLTYYFSYFSLLFKMFIHDKCNI